MSGRVQTIAILTHLRQGLDPNYYLARCQRFHWEREGRQVLVHQRIGPPPPADIAILHIDLTQVPPDYLALARHYPVCLNSRVADVAKRRISRWLVTPDDPYDGPVVVKTNLNHGGASEQRLRIAEGGVWVRMREAARRWLPRAWGGGEGSDYQLFERRSQVPAWVWRRSGLVVERFFFERHPQGFALHQWFFLGPRSLVSTLIGTTPLVKWVPVMVKPPKHHGVPEALWRRREELGIDYGKIDFVMHEGEPVVFDVNPTPHVGTTEERESNIWTCGVLAAGIDFFSDESRP